MVTPTPRGDKRLHHDHVVAVRRDARGEPLRVAHGDQLLLHRAHPPIQGESRWLARLSSGSPADEVDRVVAEVDEPEAVVARPGCRRTGRPARRRSRRGAASPAPRPGGGRTRLSSSPGWACGQRRRPPRRRSCSAPRRSRPAGPGPARSPTCAASSRGRGVDPAEDLGGPVGQQLAPRGSAGSRDRPAGPAGRRSPPPAGTGGGSPTAGSSAAPWPPRSPSRAGRRRPAPEVGQVDMIKSINEKAPNLALDVMSPGVHAGGEAGQRARRRHRHRRMT